MRHTPAKLAFAIVAGISLVQAGATASKALPEVLEVRLHVVTESGCAILLIDTKNLRAEPVYLTPEEPLAQLRHDSGEIAEIFPFSPILDRPPFRLGEHIKLTSGQSQRIEVDLNRNYSLKQGWYTVRLGGDYWDPIRNIRFPGKDAVTRFHYGANCRAGDGALR